VKARPYDLPRLYWRGRFGKTLKVSLATDEGHEGAGRRLIESLPNRTTEPDSREYLQRCRRLEERDDRPALKATPTP
jgi:hypothetical protein